MNRKLKCLFASDLHGNRLKYEKLFSYIEKSPPNLLLLGGDLSTRVMSITESADRDSLFSSFIHNKLKSLKNILGDSYPDIFVILGNDDSRLLEEVVLGIEKSGLWKYIHNKYFVWEGYNIFGYSFVPPTPFLFKDWEKYDISRFTDPGCIPPDEGIFSTDIDREERKFSTIKEDLDTLADDNSMDNTILLFHSPPYNTLLDRGDMDGKIFDHTPLDIHLGSMAIYNFIKKYQPLITMHGHIHESTRLTGSWQDKIGRTNCFNGSHDGSELSLIIFNPADPASAERELI